MPSITALRSPVAKRIIGVQRGHHHLAHLAGGDRVAGARGDDFDHHMFIGDHPLHRRAFISDVAQVGGGIGLQAENAAILVILAQRREQRPAPDRRLGDRQLHAHLVGLVQDHLQVIRRAGIDGAADIARGGDLQFGLTGAGRQHRGANGARTAFKDHPGRGQVIAETVLHDVTRPDPGGVQHPADAPPVAVDAAGLVDRARRLEDMGELRRRFHRIAAEWRLRRLRLAQAGFAQHRQACKVGNRGDRLRVDMFQGLGIARQRLGAGDLPRQGLRQIGGALIGAAGFQSIIIPVHDRPLPVIRSVSPTDRATGWRPTGS